MSCVLLVDDDERIRRLVGRVLTEAGYCVTAYSSGSHALRELATRSPDLVVTDWHMAGLDGRHVVSAARELQPGVPIIVITGRPDEAKALIDPADPVVTLLPKPFTLDLLVAVAGRLVPAG